LGTVAVLEITAVGLPDVRTTCSGAGAVRLVLASAMAGAIAMAIAALAKISLPMLFILVVELCARMDAGGIAAARVLVRISG
jgi:hypothetical protein